MHHDFAARAVEAAQGKVDAADDDRQHIVEVVGDAAGQLADRLHLLDLAELGLGGLALRGLGLQRLVRFPQFLRALADGLFERLGALGLALDLAPSSGVLAQRLDGDDAEEDGAEPDEEAEPAQIVAAAARLRRRRTGSAAMRSRSDWRSARMISSSLLSSASPVSVLVAAW